MASELRRPPVTTDAAVIELTRQWIAEVVIGLNLCPFARRVFDGGLIRYAVTRARTTSELITALTEELRLLSVTPEDRIETAFLIHPEALHDFLDYNDFVAEADQLIDELGYRGTIQIAGFHPRYQFAETSVDDVENYTNRSPYPMLHLLRESSITPVNQDPEKLAEIPRRNIALLRRMGTAGVRRLVEKFGVPLPADT